jgi:hypothetical protein
MNTFEHLLKRIEKGEASPEEIASARSAYEREFELLKQEDPVQYLEVLKILDAGLDRLERDLRQLLSELDEPAV